MRRYGSWLALFLWSVLTPLNAAADGGSVAHDPLSAQTLVQTRAELALVAEAVERYRDIAVAKAEGWRAFGGDEPMVGQHWNHPEGPDYTLDTPLDFTRPNNLMYTWIEGEPVLTGVAFVVRVGDGEPMPEGFTGSADHWHVHDLETILAGTLADRPILRWLGRRWVDNSFPGGEDGRKRLAMLHVWVTVPNPDGPFALHNTALPYLKHGLSPQDAPRFDDAVARGLALAVPEGCDNVFGGRLWLAQATRSQRRRVMDTCAEVSASIRAALPSGIDHAAPVAAEAADRMAGVYWITLERAQHDKVASLSDHGDAFCRPPAGMAPPG